MQVPLKWLPWKHQIPDVLSNRSQTVVGLFLKTTGEVLFLVGISKKDYYILPFSFLDHSPTQCWLFC